MRIILIILAILISVALFFTLYAIIRIKTDDYDMFERDFYKILEEQEKKKKKKK